MSGPITVVWKFWYEQCRWPSVVGSPLVSRGTGMENEFPWRSGPCLILRQPFAVRALAVGWWTGRAPQSEDEDGPIILFREIDLPEEDRR